MVISKEVCRLIESHFYNHEQEKKELQRRKIEIAEEIVHALDATGIRGSMTSDPTFHKARKIEKETALLQAWVEVVQDTIDHFKGTENEQFIHDVYNERTRYTQAEWKLFMSRRTFYNRREKVILYAALKACEKSLIVN